MHLKLLTLAVVLLALGCSSGAKPAATGLTASTTLTVQTTTSVASSPTTTGGTDDNSVRKRLSNAVVLEQVVYSNTKSYSADLDTLNGIDNAVKFGAGLTPSSNPAIVNVAISPDAQWVCLIAESSVVGHVFVAAVGPSNKVYAGVATLKECSATAARVLRLVPGF